MDDPTAWQIWWMYNQERFLGRSTFAIDGKSSAADRSETRVFGRLSRDEVQAEVIPAMTRGLEVGGNLRYVRAGILGLASAAESHNQGQFDFLLRHFLTVGDHTPIHHTAAVALGILGSEGSLDTLRDLALNTAAGKKLVAAEEVPIGLRAHAAYGLGMLGNGSSSSAERSGIVSDLIGLLENEASSTDLQVAAITALGMVPLELDAAATVCICGMPSPRCSPTSRRSKVVSSIFSCPRCSATRSSPRSSRRAPFWHSASSAIRTTTTRTSGSVTSSAAWPAMAIPSASVTR